MSYPFQKGTQVHTEHDSGIITVIEYGQAKIVFPTLGEYRMAEISDLERSFVDYEKDIRSQTHWRVYATADVWPAKHVDQAILFCEEVIAQKLLAANSAENRRKQETADLFAQYDPLLEQQSQSKLSSHALGAKNIRTELKKAFPWVKFSVTSKSYTGGCSIDIHWDFGPTTEEVEAITGKYTTHGFDGMQDLSYALNALHPARYGGAKHVFESRSFPKEFHDQVGRDLCALRKVPYNGQHTSGLLGENDDRDLQQHVNQLIYSTHFGAGERYAGVEEVSWEEQKASPTHLHWCRIKKTIDENDPMSRFNPLKQTTAKAPEPSSSSKSASVTPATVATLNVEPGTLNPTSSDLSVQIKRDMHDKKNVPIWICRLSIRVEREEFDRIDGIARKHNGYYSRYFAKRGFTFMTEAEAKAFAAEVEGRAATPAPIAAAPAAPAPVAPPVTNVVPVNFAAAVAPQPVPVTPAPAPLSPWRRKFMQ